MSYLCEKLFETKHDTHTFRLSWQHLSQPDGRICHEGIGEESWS